MVKKGSKFTKYSSEFKLQVVKDYEKATLFCTKFIKCFY